MILLYIYHILLRFGIGQEKNSMSKYSNKFKADRDFDLKRFPTDIRGEINEEQAKSGLKKARKKLAKLQDIMYAHDKYNVLVCLQGMDTAGKDSLIRVVFEKFNARGVVVQSYKTPTSKEHQHDYLWRHYIALPEKGKFGVFNRTHYENVLVTRVHPKYLLNENLPDVTGADSLPKDFWENRFEQINSFEKHLVQNGTIIFKFYLHLSKEEQKNRLLRRLNQEDKNWKFSPSDLSERKLWDTYMEYYEDAIRNTHTAHAPWYIIPADSKTISRYAVTKIMLEVLEKYEDIQYPELPDDIQENIKAYKKQLESE